MLLLISFACMVPSIILFFWMRNRINQDSMNRQLYNKALLRGILCVFPVLLASGLTYITLRLAKIEEANALLYQFLYKFLVLAFAEEMVKGLMLEGLLKKNKAASLSWLDIICLMTAIGIGFQIIESLAYTFDGNIGVLVVRGITLGHAGYGFIMGYFFGKGMKYGKKSDYALGFLIPWFLHGLYDFSLSEELLSINDNFVFLPVSLAFMDLVVIIVCIVFVYRSRKKEVYTEKMPAAISAEEAAAEEEDKIAEKEES